MFVSIMVSLTTLVLCLGIKCPKSPCLPHLVAHMMYFEVQSSNAVPFIPESSLPYFFFFSF